MIFVGYKFGSKGYKFWDPSNRSIVYSHDVVFDESVFPRKVANAPSDPSPIPNPSGSGNTAEAPAEPEIDFPNHPDQPADQPRPRSPSPAPAADPDEPEIPQEDHLPQPPPIAPLPRRSTRHNLGQNPSRSHDNVYGDRNPAEIDREVQQEQAYEQARQRRQVLEDRRLENSRQWWRNKVLDQPAPPDPPLPPTNDD
ncbi:hypothetical protein PHLCEN_2v9495, partial [Hermanssonia centrifuga]